MHLLEPVADAEAALDVLVDEALTEVALVGVAFMGAAFEVFGAAVLEALGGVTFFVVFFAGALGFFAGVLGFFAGDRAWMLVSRDGTSS